MMLRPWLALVPTLATACAGASPAAAPPSPPAPSPDRATVPLHVEGHRPYVDVTLGTAEGKTRRARFVVDTGGGGFLLVEPLAKELGLTLGDKIEEEGQALAAVTSPLQASIGSVPLALRPEGILVLMDSTRILPEAAPGHADGLLPGHVLAGYDVVFDYGKGTFTIGKPGTVTPEGTATPLLVHPFSGFARTEIEVDGTAHGMLLDTGASFTMVSEVLLTAWGSAHGDWKRYPGAYGEAVTLGGTTLETMFVPRANWSGFELVDMGVVSQHEGTFEQWMSSMMVQPVIGSLAGNVLEQFRVQLDYANQKLYLTRQ